LSVIKTPSHLSQVLTVMRFEFLKFFKGKKLYGMIIFAFAIPILLVALPEFVGSEYPHFENDFVASQMSFMVIVIIISATFFGSSAIVSEFHDKTAYSLLPNPINRESIWFGKYFAALAISFMISSIFYMVIAVGTWAEYESVPQEILSSWGLSFAFVMMPYNLGPHKREGRILFLLLFPSPTLMLWTLAFPCSLVTPRHAFMPVFA